MLPSEAPSTGLHASGRNHETSMTSSTIGNSTKRKTGVHFSLAPHSVTTTVVTTTTTKITEFPHLVINPPSIPKNLDASVFPLAHTPTPPALKRFCFDLNGVPARFKEFDIFEDDNVCTSSFVGANDSGTVDPEVASEHLRKHFDNVSAVTESTSDFIRPNSRKRARMNDDIGMTSVQIDESEVVNVTTPLQNSVEVFPRTPAPGAPSRLPVASVPLTPYPEANHHVHTISSSAMATTPPAQTSLQWPHPPAPPTINPTAPINTGLEEEAESALSRNLPSPTMSPTATSLTPQLNQLQGVVASGQYLDPVDSSSHSMFRHSRTLSPSLSRLTPDPTGNSGDEMDIVPINSNRSESRPPTLSDLPAMIASFDSYPDSLQSYVLFQLMRRSNIKTLQFMSQLILPVLRCDFIGMLPVELSFQILEYLDLRSLGRCTAVSKRWHRVVDGEGAETAVWKKMLMRDGWYREEEVREEMERRLSASKKVAPKRRVDDRDSMDELDGLDLARKQLQSEEDKIAATKASSFLLKQQQLREKAAAVFEMFKKDKKDRVLVSASSNSRRPLAVPTRLNHPEALLSNARLTEEPRSAGEKGKEALSFGHKVFKGLYKKHYAMQQNWRYGRFKTVAFPGHGTNVVTCLQFDDDKIVSGSDDTTIHIYDTKTGQLRRKLVGHEGGVWALQYWKNSLVTGSTDRTVRVWDMETGRCTHLFEGHTSTVRCLMIVPPVLDANARKSKKGGSFMEPSMPGSSSMSSLASSSSTLGLDKDGDPTTPLIVTGSRDATLRVWRLPDPANNPDESEGVSNGTAHFMHVLNGHTNSVRAIAGHGRMLVSGSYDATVRLWDLVTGESVFVFRGHREKVYSVGYSHELNRAVSGSMDANVKVWCTKTGVPLFNLEGHSSLVGLLELSPKYIVSAAADMTLRIWSPTNGQCLATLAGHAAAITCFHHEPSLNRIVSGSDGGVKVWELSSAGNNGHIQLNAGGNANLGPGHAFTQGPGGAQPVHGRFIRDLVSEIRGVWRVRMDEQRLVCAVQREGDRTWFEVLDFGEGVEAGVRIEGPGDGGWPGNGDNDNDDFAGHGHGHADGDGAGEGDGAGSPDEGGEDAQDGEDGEADAENEQDAGGAGGAGSAGSAGEADPDTEVEMEDADAGSAANSSMVEDEDEDDDDGGDEDGFRTAPVLTDDQKREISEKFMEGLTKNYLDGGHGGVLGGVSA
ncbi:SCF ubiquitin ligase complex subunit cdc4 [Phlyctochytrium planicorne]|nr:SCF ubiquitin ligase complex subunit cdc4 [Phlyctochytrium planicorne]